MKVLYFHQHFSTPKGAAGIRSYEMARRLMARGHFVTMVCGTYGVGQTGLGLPFINGRRRGVVDGIDVIEFELPYFNADSFLKRSMTFLKFAWRSIGVAFSESYDVVFATTTPLTAGIPGILARWLRRKPFVFEVRDLWPELPKAMGVITNPVVLGAMSIIEWASYHSANHVIALSPGIAEGVAKRGISQNCITMIPNGCDLDIFAEPTTPWRPEGVDANDLLAVYAGTHGLANGLDAVLDAASELKRRGNSSIKLLLIGQGQLKPALQERAQRDGLDNVIFHAPVNKAKLAGLMNATDIGLQILANVPAFYYGTSPNKFFDYIAAGIPVLNNYPGWLAGIIARANCGFAIPPADPKAFADALEKAAADKAALRIMGENSRNLARAEFSRHKLADQWVDVIEALAKKA
jgi:glycosyltransferase involved in cell wall biosynthesis